MSILHSLEIPLQWTVDCFYKRLPQKHPDKQRLYDCKIISHRGEHDNLNVLENTLASFDLIKEKGIWGIEFDIRWTKDLIPVVFHDKDLKRLFQSDIEVSKITQSDLKKKFPAVPTLSEVIIRYGGKMHLMAEIKEEVYPDPAYQNSVLQDLFSSEGVVTDISALKDWVVTQLEPADKKTQRPLNTQRRQWQQRQQQGQQQQQ